MATVTNAGTGKMASLFNNLSGLQSAGLGEPSVSVSRSATQIFFNPNQFARGPIFTGTGFTFDAAGRPTGGTVTEVSEPSYKTIVGYGITGIQVPLTTLYAAAVQRAGATLVPGVLSGGDTFRVDVFGADGVSETLSGYGGDDVFYVLDTFSTSTVGRTEPVVDGGPGVDTVASGRLRSTTTVEVRPGSFVVGPNGNEGGGPDTYVSIEALRFADGTLSFDPGTTGGQVYILFQTALGRAPGAGELGYFTDAASRYGLPATAFGLLATAEGQARLGRLDDAGFVNAVYRSALGRDAEPSGLQYWQGRLAAGGAAGAGRGAVLAGIAETDEAGGRFAAALAPGVFGADPKAVAVDRAYLAATGALPGAGLLAYEATQPVYGTEKYLAGQGLNAGLSDADYVTSARLSNADFVASLVRNAYGANASDPGAVAYYTQILNGAGTRAAVIDTRAAVIDAYAFSPGIDARVAPYVTDQGVLHA